MSTLIIFYRTVKKDESVSSLVEGSIDGKHLEVGKLDFPTKQSWSKFIGAVQRGALNVKDLEVRLENREESSEAE